MNITNAVAFNLVGHFYTIKMENLDLIVRGHSSPYLDDIPVIKCFYEIPGTKKIYIPCRFSKLKREYKHVDFPEPTMQLRPDQKDVISEIENRCESLGDIASYTIFCNIHTGFGKTVFSSIWAMSKKLPILVIVNSDAVRQAWYKTFQDNGIKAHIAEGNTLGQHDVCILSIQLAVLHKFSRSEYAYYGTVICDEADTLCTQKAAEELVKMCPRYFLGESATITKENGLDKMLDKFWDERKYWIVRQREFGQQSALKIKILNTSYQIESKKNRKNALDWTQMCSDIIDIDERNMLIRNLCLLHFNDKILIHCKRKQHVEVLEQMLKDVGIDVAVYYGSDSTYHDAHVLITTLSKGGRGFDDKQVSSSFDGQRFNVIILTITMKNADQAIGRGRGEDTTVYQICDENSTFKSHAKLLRSINEKRGAIVTEEYV